MNLLHLTRVSANVSSDTSRFMEAFVIGEFVMSMRDRKPSYPEASARFGSWVFVRPGEGYSWIMRCDCGTVKSVRSQDIRQGASKSCGCISTGGRGGLKNKTHGMDYGSKLYRTWRNAKNRCFNPKAEKYQAYGAVQITMCDEWAASFQEFAKYLGEPPSSIHSLDRIDNSRGYEPGNVRWATPEEQVNNRGCTIRVSHEGQLVTLSELSQISGISYGTLACRQRSGWPEDLITRPLGYRLSATDKLRKTPKLVMIGEVVDNLEAPE